MKLPRQFTRYRIGIAIAVLFLVHVYFSFYNLERWAVFGWDQLDNAWAALRILLVHKYPLLGMVAKQNSGMYIGPLYYYLVALFYFLTRLDPIASPILASTSALVSFWILYYVTKRMFSGSVALIACFIYTFSSYITLSERIQWPVTFIAPVGLLIFYFLSKILAGEVKYFIHLAVAFGISLHIHFTSLFYPIIILAVLPLVPMSAVTLKYIALSIPIGILFLLPQIIYYLKSPSAHGFGSYSTYLESYYHGFHLRRLLQISHDAFIKFQSILEIPYRSLRNGVFFYIPIFLFSYLYKHVTAARLKLGYLLGLWIVVPWVVFSTYKGEISDYYFSSQLYIAVIVFAYITVWLWARKHMVLRGAIVLFWAYWTVVNIQEFYKMPEGHLTPGRVKALETIQRGQEIHFTEGDPQSYFGWYYLYIQKKPLPFEL